MKSKLYLFGFLVFNTLISKGQHSKDKMFTLLNADQTNIHFNNRIQDFKEHNILIYSNYYGGAGVGIGDFNNDGLQDIFFAGNLEGDRLYRNKGRMQFEDVTQTAGIEDNGGWSSGVVVGDINNDGWQDIYVTRELYDDRPELRRNKLYINTTARQKDGHIAFEESAARYGLDDPARTRHAAFLDYNRDGLLDVFLLNQPPNPGNFSTMFGTDLRQEKYSPRLYQNNGDNSFSDITAGAGLLKTGFANSVSVLDANNDGWQDIYVSNDFDAPDFFYLNNGDGTFKDVAGEALRHISYFSMGVDAADINNDGNLDLMVVDMVAEDNYRLKSNMSGMDPNAFWEIVNRGGHYQYMFNTMQLQQGMVSGVPYYSDIAQMAGVPSTDWSWSNVIADFDNDGYKDIYVTNGLLRDIRNTDSDKAVAKYINKVANDFVQQNPNAGDVSIWDILDLEKTLAHIPSEKLSNYAYKNTNGLTFEKVSEGWGVDHKAFSNGCAYGDLDNDGDLDLVVSNINEPAFVYENRASELVGKNYLRVRLMDSKSNRPVLGSRVEITQGGSTQLYEFTSVRGMYSSSEQIAHFGLSGAGKVEAVKITWPDRKQTLLHGVSANQTIVADFNKSGEVSVNNTKATSLFEPVEILTHEHRENKFDDYKKQVLLPHKMSEFGPAIARGDVNGDGLEDVFIGGAVGTPSVLYLQNGDGTFEKQEGLVNSTPYEDVDAALFDADNDGDKDLYIVSGGNEWNPNNPRYQDRLYLNDGHANFEFHMDGLPAMTESGSCVRPFDFDGDGDLDLFVGGRHTPWNYPAPVTSRLLENQGGFFTDVTDKLAKALVDIGMVTDAVWIDYDKDGNSDLVLAGEWMPLTFLRNNGSGFENVTKNAGIAHSEGWWFSLEATDLNNDGHMDLVAGNLGLNYKYKASVDEPFEVHYDDFDQNGQHDIVLSYYNFGEQFPLRGRSCSSQQVPLLGEKFKTYNVFASATLSDVYGQNKLQSALNYKARTFASAVFINNGSGQFDMKPLPLEAQLSSINDIIVKDFDSDGHVDILVAGNLYQSEVETTRNDAGTGMLLMGNGQGDFIPLSPSESGILLPFDVKKLVMIKREGSEVLLAAVNNGKVRAFSLTKSIMK